jgi:hypothetical protein
MIHGPPWIVCWPSARRSGRSAEITASKVVVDFVFDFHHPYYRYIIRTYRMEVNKKSDCTTDVFVSS